MLSLLETGQALYVLAGICVLGVFARLMTRNLYKRLIRESTNLAAAGNRGLKELRQRAENAYHINQGMRDTASWLEHQLAELRFCGMTLGGWSNLSARLTWLCLLAGGGAAFYAYWHRLDTSYIVMYGGSSVLMAMLTLFLDGGGSLSRREQLLAALQDHLENTMFPRMERISERTGSTAARNAADQAAASREILPEREAESALRAGSLRNPGGRENGIPETGGAAEAVRLQGKSRLSGRQIFADRPGHGKRREHASENDPAPQEQTAAAVMPQPENPCGDAAAELSAGTEGRNWLKDLGPEEARVIGDILKQYLT